MTATVIRFREKLARNAVGLIGMRSGELSLDARSNQVLGQFYGCRLTSVYQPIVALAEGQIVGYQAFIRSHHNELGGVSPRNLFALQAQDEDLVQLDRLCRTLHTLNYFASLEPRPPLFMSVHGRLLLAVRENHGRAFRGVLDSLQIPPQQITLEFRVTTLDEFPLLAKTATSYRYYGFKIALNVRSLNDALSVANLIRPDMLKLDSQHIATLPGLAETVAQLHQQNITTIATRVETSTLLEAMQQAAIQAVQGFAVAVPTAEAVCSRPLHNVSTAVSSVLTS